MAITDETKSKMNAALEHFKGELKKLRSGRANPTMLDSVLVEVYGTQMRLKEVANVTSPEPRQLLITPFDPQTAGSIRKGIESANLNLNPILEGATIRINIPPLDQKTREDIAKQGKKKAEESKVSIREIRRKSNEVIKKQKADGEITEDQVKKLEKTIQDLTDNACKEIDDLFAKKEKEVMTI